MMYKIRQTLTAVLPLWVCKPERSPASQSALNLVNSVNPVKPFLFLTEDAMKDNDVTQKIIGCAFHYHLL